MIAAKAPCIRNSAYASNASDVNASKTRPLSRFMDPKLLPSVRGIISNLGKIIYSDVQYLAYNICCHMTVRNVEHPLNSIGCY